MTATATATATATVSSPSAVSADAPADTGSWSPGSWRTRTAAQQPDWPDPEALHRVESTLAFQPPLVLPDEIMGLRGALAGVAAGEGFLLQAGDCAERFASCTEDGIRSKLRVILQVAVVLTYGSGLPVVKVGRIAGQFGKPRSRPTETIGGEELPVYRGDIVNAPEFTAEARRPDADRLLRAYQHSSAALNVLRALTLGGYADLGQAHAWNQEFVRRSAAGRRYESAADDISRALRFMTACGVDARALSALQRIQLYTSHEALLPPYEEALTRYDERRRTWFGTSAHMLWIGDRTRDPDGAHVELLSGLGNPVGVKVGPGTTPQGLRALCERLDPDREPGRLVLITRLGAGRSADLLPPLLHAVRSAGHVPVWACDPMHGNTFVSDSGYKTRRLSDVTAEVAEFFAVHREEGTHPGGIHLELTGDDVTECLGGDLEEILDGQLGTRYETACDPRLNAVQSLELAFRVGDLLRSQHSV
ncbi:3-deoxy-7-phosphoheptulonate synthase class II [Streptomyces sp. NBC_00190]|uniref:class II 3-deoxy-7-phosphoheptulonate synthase n=1 Tax=unclassified Streptomyces TaxID=2593676 RepID=UPI002E294E76|nr:3-deoxy-7-phosphoheptulonate synthase class II [Streptomyces sp. NBC_00190]WSZ42929.1 3-deoxy-7-phosphoheptulonate synthase class II [Streptomyces sp. NBC_00868]